MPARLRLPAAALLALGLSAAPSRAELVVMVGGEVVKVSSYAADDTSARLELAGGGVLTLPIERVERVVEDEVEEPEETAVSEAALPPVEVHFAESQGIPEGRFGGLAYWAARRHELNPRIVAAVARAESNWNPEARSRKGACGLMQLMPATASRFGLRHSDLFDVEKNLDAGSRYLAWLVTRFDGRLDHVLAAYNAGEGAVERYGGVPPYRETREYVRRVFDYLGVEEAVAAGGGPAIPSAASATALFSALR